MKKMSTGRPSGGLASILTGSVGSPMGSGRFNLRTSNSSSNSASSPPVSPRNAVVSPVEPPMVSNENETGVSVSSGKEEETPNGEICKK